MSSVVIGPAQSWNKFVPRVSHVEPSDHYYFSIFGVKPDAHGAPRDKSPYFAQVIDARPLAEGVSADTVYTARDNVTVVWLGGLDYLPADYKLQ